MKTLVTGATGLVGHFLVEQLLEEGTAVKAFCLPREDRQNVEGQDIEIAEGDLRDEASVKRAMKGVDRVFHVAAMVNTWVPPGDRMNYHVNTLGTRHLLDAALHSGKVKQFVFTSTCSVLGPPLEAGRMTNERDFFMMWNIRDHYIRSKVAAMQEVYRFGARGLPVRVVYPSSPIGPGDFVPGPWGKMLLRIQQGKMPVVVDGPNNWVDARDCARGHLLVSKKGKDGEDYIICGENRTVEEAVGIVSEFLGKTPPKLKIPTGVAKVVGLGIETLSNQWLKFEPPFTGGQLSMAEKYMHGFDGSKAQRELGYKPQFSLQDTLRDTYAYFENWPSDRIDKAVGM